MKTQQAISLLESVPEDDFIIDIFTNGVDKCCALGHLMRLQGDPTDYSNENCADYLDSNAALNVLNLRSRSYTFLGKSGSYGTIATVNNDRMSPYLQDTPKQRVLQLLRDMDKAGY